jgi:hypothetical protein
MLVAHILQEGDGPMSSTSLSMEGKGKRLAVRGIEGCLLWSFAQLGLAAYTGSFMLVGACIFVDTILAVWVLRQTKALELIANATNPSATYSESEVEALTKILEIWTSKQSS